MTPKVSETEEPMNKTTTDTTPENALAQQQQEQIAAAVADAEVAENRADIAQKKFGEVCTQAAAALGTNPQSVHGQVLMGALTAAFQWGAEFANASDHAQARREEVQLLARIAKAQEAELGEGRRRRSREAEESAIRTDLLTKQISLTEKQVALMEKHIAILEATRNGTGGPTMDAAKPAS